MAKIVVHMASMLDLAFRNSLYFAAWLTRSASALTSCLTSSSPFLILRSSPSMALRVFCTAFRRCMIFLMSLSGLPDDKPRASMVA